MKIKSENTAQGRGGRSFTQKMTVEIPTSILTELKIHAARRQATVREIVVALVKKEIGQ